MSEYYNPKRARLFEPPPAGGSTQPFYLSRTGLDSFIKCPRCFYLDYRLGAKQPPGFPFSLNAAVDHLLKKEFDLHRAKNKAHPLMEKYNIKAVPMKHEKLDEWRDNRRGIRYHHQKSNFIFFGAIDDVWQDSKGNLFIVDYKATSKDSEVNLDAEWQDGYKRQMEIYQWLFRQNGFKVSDTGYFVYANGQRDKKAFDAKLEFDIKIIAYKGDDKWVEKALMDARKCLEDSKIPAFSDSCDYCAYLQAVDKTMEKTNEKNKELKLF